MWLHLIGEGMVVTSLNLLPCGRLEGGRIAQSMFGRSTASVLSFTTSLLLGIGGLSGSVLCLAWGLFATFFRGGEEIPAKDEITPLGDDRYAWGLVLFLICFLTLFPNGGGTFSSSFLSAPYFRDGLWTGVQMFILLATASILWQLTKTLTRMEIKYNLLKLLKDNIILLIHNLILKWLT